MPITYAINHDRKLVIATGLGAIVPKDVYDYQREVWSQPEVVGYNEIVDFSAVEDIQYESGDRISEFARFSADMDRTGVISKLAIVAPADLSYGIGRMYQSYRELQGHTEKQVGVFRTMEDAEKWISEESN